MSVTSEQIAEQLKALLPPGKAITRAVDSNTHKLMLALADELVRVYVRHGELADEFFPSAVDELLVEWETEVGLPDPCVTAPQTIPERIAALVAKVTGTGGQSRQYFIDIAASLGLAITITENKPFELGVNGMGDPIGGAQWWYIWNVNADQLATTAQRQQLECLFQAVKPAHTAIIFSYTLDASIPPPPATITTPTGTTSTDFWNVSWDASANATYYELLEIYNGGAPALVFSGSSIVVGFIDKPDGTYQYAVRACNLFGCSTHLYSTTFTLSA